MTIVVWRGQAGMWDGCKSISLVFQARVYQPCVLGEGNEWCALTLYIFLIDVTRMRSLKNTGLMQT